mgnify:CR=1 FL=1
MAKIDKLGDLLWMAQLKRPTLNGLVRDSSFGWLRKTYFEWFS